MKLLFDQNLSHRLVALTKDLFPVSLHVKDIELQEASDSDIWEYAKSNDLTIISKDSDFHQRSFVFGPPPKVIWIQKGNCSTSDIHSLILKFSKDILTFIEEEKSSFMVLDE